MNLVAFAAGMLVYVALWELVARSLDVPMVSLGPAELAQRLGLVEAIALRLAPPVAAIALPGGDRPGALPPPPLAPLTAAERFALRVPLGHFVVVYQRELELPAEYAQLVQLDQALGNAGGWRPRRDN